MYMYQNKLLILVFLIAGYSGYVDAGEESASVAGGETRSNDSSVQLEKGSTSQNNQATNQNPATQNTPAQTKQTAQQSKKPAKQSKQTANIENQTNKEDKPNKPACVFKGVMSDDDYYACGIKPYTKIICFKKAAKK